MTLNNSGKTRDISSIDDNVTVLEGYKAHCIYGCWPSWTSIILYFNILTQWRYTTDSWESKTTDMNSQNLSPTRPEIWKSTHPTSILTASPSFLILPSAICLIFFFFNPSIYSISFPCFHLHPHPYQFPRIFHFLYHQHHESLTQHQDFFFSTCCTKFTRGMLGTPNWTRHNKESSVSCWSSTPQN